MNAQATLIKCAAQKDHAIRSGHPLTEFQVTEAEYAALLTLSVIYFDERPAPPVKSSTEIIREAGLFSNEIRFARIEYDHHAPDYLEALKQWRAEPKKPPYLFGIPVKISEQ